MIWPDSIRSLLMTCGKLTNFPACAEVMAIGPGFDPSNPDNFILIDGATMVQVRFVSARPGLNYKWVPQGQRAAIESR